MEFEGEMFKALKGRCFKEVKHENESPYIYLKVGFTFFFKFSGKDFTFCEVPSNHYFQNLQNVTFRKKIKIKFNSPCYNL